MFEHSVNLPDYFPIYTPELITVWGPNLNDFIFNTATAAVKLLVHKPHLHIGNEGAANYTQNDCLKPVRVM